MNGEVVPDSTCLIAFERIGTLDMLTRLCDKAVIPPAVAREFGVDLPWLKVEEPRHIDIAVEGVRHPVNSEQKR